MSDYKALLAQKEELDRKQAELARLMQEALSTERKGAIERIRAIMAEFGVTVEDLAPRSPRGAPKQKGGEERAKVAPKYRDPATGATWTGRGLKPKWLAAYVSAGRAVEEFAIAAS